MRMKIHREGRRLLLLSFITLFFLNLLVHYLFENTIITASVFAVFAIVYLLLANFFRSPRRHYKGETDGIVLAPADGTVVAIEEVEETEYFHDKRIQLSIFMSVFNVHANWYPINGKVTYVKHHDGRFMAAYLPKSSTENERSTVVIRTENGEEILMRQIAGAMARRIVTYAEVGDNSIIDEHMGFIKFGSRVDLFLPLGTEILVKLEDKTTGNMTPVARLK